MKGEVEGRLKGLWSARVGSYSIIYSIEGSRRSPKVIVTAIKHRSSAYGQRQPRRLSQTHSLATMRGIVLTSLGSARISGS